MPITNLVNFSHHYPTITEFKEGCSEMNYVKSLFLQDHYKDMWSSYKACKSIVIDSG